MRFVPGYTADALHKRSRAKSSRLLLGSSPTYPVTCDNRGLEQLQEDQGPFGSCGGHGTSQRLQVVSNKQGVILPVCSPGDIYKVTRCIERIPGQPLTDSGIMPADLVVALNQWGVRPLVGTVTDPDGTVRVSDCWQGNVNTDPVLEDLEADAQSILMGQYRVDETAGDALPQVFAAIATLGAVGLGIFVDTAFQNWDPSQGPLSTVNVADPNGGGHWLTADYYDSSAGTIGLWNSWGSSWGRNGHIEVSASWFAKAVSDIYADKLRLVAP